MSEPGTAMLFLPPLPPKAVPEQGSLVLGRSKSCDLTLPSPDASRRHAEIVVEAGRFLLRDLGSTNGTFVNGERVQEHTLSAGDRIEIGGDLITFCQIDAALEAASPFEGGDQAATRMSERPVLTECIQGSLAEIPPFAVIQMLEMGRKSGLLAVDESHLGVGHLWLADGSPVHAETKAQRGFDAAISIVHAKTGRFSFEPGRAAPEHTIRASATELLLEAARHLDENL